MDAEKVLLLILFQGIANVVQIFAAEKDSTNSSLAYFTTRKQATKRPRCATVWVSKFVVVRQLVFEEHLMYFHKFQDGIQEWQRNVWT